jgi:DNA-binding NtrC family response regulator
VNCGALAENLLESELFGHKRGAFTDARVASEGLIAEAEGGTLFLDEVDSLSPKAQAALLRFLQDKSYRPVGGGVLRQSNARVLVASNVDLAQLAQARHFRLDLYYRLSVLQLRLPPLRERGDDAIELARVFLRRLSHQHGDSAGRRLHPDLEAYIRAYPWPGNVRELEHAIQRAYLMGDAADSWLRLYREDAEFATDTPSEVDFKQAKARAIAEFERGYVERVLNQTNGNITQAARIAGQDRSVFSKLVRKHKTTQPAPG